MNQNLWIISRVIRVIIAITCVYLAKKKNKNQFYAFIAGYFLSIFALGYYLIVKGQKVTTGGSVLLKCKNCGEVFSGEKRYCPGCTSEAISANVKRA